MSVAKQDSSEILSNDVANDNVVSQLVLTTAAAQKVYSLMVEEDNLKHKKVPPEIRKLIQGRRGELKWTQKELAQKCNFQVTIINDIETGKANYNPQHITKIKRILKL